MKKFYFLFIFFGLSTTLFADTLNIRQYPEYPSEGESVTLTLLSDKYNLNIANIVWVIDGVEADTGVGRKTITFKANINGQAQTISVYVSQEGYDDSQTQTIVEANTNFILYEGVDSYVPNFYKGRRLPSREGTTRVAFFGFKNGNIVGLSPEDNDTYAWKINGEEKKENSGVNKIVNQILAKVTDTALSIRTSKQDVNGKINIAEENIPLAATETIIYKTDENKLSREPISSVETGKKIYLEVQPFFFTTPSKKDPNIIYTWKLNDIKTEISSPWSVLFSGTDRDSVKINLNIINNKKVSQESEKGFTFKVE